METTTEILELNKPFLIEFSSVGNPSFGYLSMAEQMGNIPFNIKRVYWTYYTPQDVLRGGHANIDKELVLVAVSGRIKTTVELIDGYTKTYQLNRPNVGLYIPKLCWHTMQYSHNAVQMVMASNLYSEKDYIRDYTEFKTFFQK
jgi:hypothetical protein